MQEELRPFAFVTKSKDERKNGVGRQQFRNSLSSEGENWVQRVMNYGIGSM